MLTFWFRPAAAALFWIAVAATTLAELTTVAPSLRAAGGGFVSAPSHATPAVAGRRHR
jgi:hypothetical protein